VKQHIPGQWKAQPKPKENESTNLYQEIAKFGVNDGESIVDALARFTAKTGKVVPPELLEEVKDMEEHKQRNDHGLQLVKTADNLETYFSVFIEKVAAPWVRDEYLELQTIFSSWLNQQTHKHGNKRYQVTLGLAERLAFTELRGIYARDIRLPFPAIIVEIPASLAFGIENLKIPKALLIQEEAPGGSAQLAGISRVWNMSLIPLQQIGHLKEDERTILARLFFWEDLKWEASVQRSSVELYQLSPLVPMGVQLDMFAASGNPDVQRKLMNLAANLVLYATNHNARAVPTNKEFVELGERIQKAPPGAKKERLKERRRSLDPDYKIVLGTGVKRIPDEVREGDKIGVRTLVSGFWRNQVFGPAKTLNEEGEKVWIPAEKREHQMKWISPFWRGLELGDEAPVTNPIRVMKEL